jgi:hypothetical protein
MPGEPEDDFVYFRLRPPFLLGFLDVQRIDTRKTNRVDSRFGKCLRASAFSLLKFVES